MRFKKGLGFEVYILSANDLALIDAGIDVKKETNYNDDTEIRVFFSVDIIYEYGEDPRITVLVSSGLEHLVKGDLFSILEIIENNNS